ncbi:proteoglycan 4 isoform X2 [Trichoplusia ni]|uniref:Proteoglycan 4 isoform X2 n=1 Tax=Trichoplusia ni TaxID=7111 RepID=A0A7E5VYI8_TRINI|nr:proteoglycan 4 isoform X2 [Trichoplusia ni]
MATKSYSKHKEYKEFSSSGTIPYTDEQFDMLKSELIPKGSKLDSLGRGGGTREYHYEYKEEKHPSGKYDRKDMHTVEEYTIPPRTVPKSSETSSYYYEREERDLPAITSGTRTYNYESSTSSTPGYSKVKSSKVSKDLTQNVEELDSLLDDLQKDQERQLYKSKNHDGYTSDTAESTSFDYRRGTPAKAPSSGYSTLKREERLESSSWGSSPPPTITRAAEVRQELYREEKTEVRPVPVQTLPLPAQAPPAPCTHCHHTNSSTGTLSRSGTPMNKVTTTVKTYTYEVPADQDPTTVPIPTGSEHHHTYVTEHNRITTTGSSPVPVAPAPGGCQYCSHCNSSTREYRTVTTTDERNNERMVYPTPANEVKLLPSEPHNGHGPYGPTTYKYSETSYLSQNTSQRFPPAGPAPGALHPAPSPSPGPFPRPTTPSPGTQQPPKKLDDLLADFPEARFPTQPDGVVRRNVHVSHESSAQGTLGCDTRDARDTSAAPSPKPPIVGSRNVAGPAVYYPPGHTPFQKKEGGGYQASSAMQQGGGSYAAGRGMYEYESGSRSKESHSEKKTAVPICLPLCCAMPCVIM